MAAYKYKLHAQSALASCSLRENPANPADFRASLAAFRTKTSHSSRVILYDKQRVQ